MRYDMETLFDDLLEIVRANLNDKITAIQDEKESLLGSDNFVVNTIEDNAWFDSMDENTINFDPFVFYKIDSINPIELEATSATQSAITFLVIAHYDGDDIVMYKKMLRYIRALQEVIEDNYDKITQVGTIKVVTLSPETLIDNDNEQFHKVGGISIQASIA